ncbi:MAG TPA: TIGR03619 family F420-dependent LLM class oxidoreductase [Mycobacteriales bacterium]|jgi:probable F420-dependent oxidoreductase|nr:TIGR03619 family F420-dependent LLM class oxidoreductase [Mycobacteriales bacterium]
MQRPAFTMAVAMGDPRDYTALARTAEECGFDQVAVPDSIFWSEQVSDAYPYTSDGSRMWRADTPFVDPFQAVTAMAAATSRIRFCTHVVKVGVRNAVLLAKQVQSTAVLTGGRFTFGAGVGWLREEFEWCGQRYEQRGARVDEELEALRGLLTGDWTELRGEHVQFGRIRMSPPPPSPVPFYIGGHTPVALRRTVRFGDGWTSAMITVDELKQVVASLREQLAAAGRSDEGFAVQVASSDRYGLEGYRELVEIGATDIVTVPWVFYGVPLDGPLEAKQDGLRRFAAEVIDRW